MAQATSHFRLPVFYNPAQSIDGLDSFSPSPGKPRAFVDMIRDHPHVHVQDGFQPVTGKLLALVHDPGHVKDVLSLRKPNGFGTTSREVAESVLWTNGSFVHAAIRALETNSVTMSPTSGFHHAEYSAAAGFCTFNGLALAARVVKDRWLASRVGILDLDAHYGNGTDDIIRRLGMDYVTHFTFGAEGVNDPARFVRELPGILDREFSRVDLLLYQAGADPHVSDPLGGHLTTAQLQLRDATVFHFTRSRGIPVAWNLAGGYQKPIKKVLEIHRNTLEACVRTYA